MYQIVEMLITSLFKTLRDFCTLNRRFKTPTPTRPRVESDFDSNWVSTRLARFQLLRRCNTLIFLFLIKKHNFKDFHSCFQTQSIRI